MKHRLSNNKRKDSPKEFMTTQKSMILYLAIFLLVILHIIFVFLNVCNINLWRMFVSKKKLGIN